MSLIRHFASETKLMRQSRHYLLFITIFVSSISEFSSYLTDGLSFVLVYFLLWFRQKWRWKHETEHYRAALLKCMADATSCSNNIVFLRPGNKSVWSWYAGREEEIRSAIGSPWVAQRADIYDHSSKEPMPERSGICVWWPQRRRHL
jgi:hypothetical protein